MCDKCKGKRIIQIGETWGECECVLKDRFKYVYQELLPCPKLTTTIKTLVKKIEDEPRLLIPKMNRNAHKTFLIHLLYKTLDFSKDFKIIKTYELMDIYLGKVEDVSIYDFKQKTLIFMYGFTQIFNKQEINLLLQVIDSYMQTKCRIYVYNHDNNATINTALLDKGFKLVSMV